MTRTLKVFVLKHLKNALFKALLFTISQFLQTEELTEII